jgi:hypothetical protein
MQLIMKMWLKKLKQYKWAFLGLALLVILGVVWLFLQSRESEQGATLTPVKIKDEENTKDPVPTTAQNTFYIEYVYPPSGKVQVISEYTTILYSFSKPLMADNIKVEVKPYITLEKNLSEDMKTLYISPQSEPWQNQVYYLITISNIRSTTGEELDEKVIRHTYYKEEPPMTEMGESPLE